MVPAANVPVSPCALLTNIPAVIPALLATVILVDDVERVVETPLTVPPKVVVTPVKLPGIVKILPV